MLTINFEFYGEGFGTASCADAGIGDLFAGDLDAGDLDCLD